MALEAWAHLCVERGERVQAVIDDVLGPEGSPAAYLLVAVDVMLSHCQKMRECLWPFAASAELLALDRQRFAYDTVNGNGFHTAWVRPEPAGTARLDRPAAAPLASHAARRGALRIRFAWTGRRA